MKFIKFDFLVAIYIACVAIAEFMGAKTVPLFMVGDFQINGSVALLVVPLIFTINDMIVEVHGKERARSVVTSGLLVMLLIAVTSLIATHLPPSARFTASEPAYDAVFQASARISAASLTAFALSQFLDVQIFSRLREKLGKKALWLRNNVSNVLAQLIDTVVFISLAFYAFDQTPGSNLTFLLSIILPYWLLKCTMSILETPLVYWGVKWLKSP